MALSRFELDVTPGGGRLVIDGVDLTNVTRAASLTAVAHEVPRLAVEVLGQGHADGLADVTIVQAGPDLAEFFANIDADELERVALGRLEGFDDRSATQVMLEVLAEWAGAR